MRHHGPLGAADPGAPQPAQRELPEGEGDDRPAPPERRRPRSRHGQEGNGMITQADVHFREEAELTWLGKALAAGPALGLRDPASLARLAEEKETSLPVRLGAAAVLAVCGDPRTPPEIGRASCRERV